MAQYGDYASNPALTRRMAAAGLGMQPPQQQQQQAVPALGLGGAQPVTPTGPATANPVASNQELYDTMAGRINRYMAVPSAKRDPYGRGDLEAEIGRGSFTPQQQQGFQGLFNPAPAQPVFVGSQPPARTGGY